MKSERRHELQHNDLADWLVNTYEGLVPYRNSIIGVSLLLIVGAIAFAFYRSHSATQAAEGWNKLEVPEAEILQPVFRAPQYVQLVEQTSSQYGGTSAGEWATTLTGDSYLYFSVEQLSGGQKDVGEQNLKKTTDIYDKVLAGSPSWMARERAMFGKARVLESLGQFTEATAAYEGLNKAFPKGSYKLIAEQRLEELGKPGTAEFYKQLAQYAPKPKTESPKADSPKSKLDKITLPENPPEEPKAPKTSGSAAAAKPEPSKSSAGPAFPVAPKTTAEAAKPPAAKAEGPKMEAPKAEAPKAEAPKAEAPKPEAPKAEPAKSTAAAPEKK